MFFTKKKNNKLHNKKKTIKKLKTKKYKNHENKIQKGGSGENPIYENIDPLSTFANNLIKHTKKLNANNFTNIDINLFKDKDFTDILRIPFFSQYDNTAYYMKNSIIPILKAYSFTYNKETIYLVRQYILSKDTIESANKNVQFKPHTFYIEDSSKKNNNNNKLYFNGTLNLYNLNTNKLYTNDKINVHIHKRYISPSEPYIDINNDLNIDITKTKTDEDNNYLYYVEFNENKDHTKVQELYTSPSSKGKIFKTFKGLYWISYKNIEDTDIYIKDTDTKLLNAFINLIKNITHKPVLTTTEVKKKVTFNDTKLLQKIKFCYS